MLTQSVFRETCAECFIGICSRNISYYCIRRCRGLAFIYVRHRIESTLGKRTAASQSFQRQHDAAPRSVPRNRFLSVLRARRIKLASAPEKMRKKNSIKLHKSERNPGAQRSPFRFHGVGNCSALRFAWEPTSPARLPAEKIPPSPPCCVDESQYPIRWQSPVGAILEFREGGAGFGCGGPRYPAPFLCSSQTG